MKDADQIARGIADDILAGWSLPGMSIGHQIKNGCLEGELRQKIASAMREYGEDLLMSKRLMSFEVHNNLVEKADADGYLRGYHEATEWQMKMRIQDAKERSTGGGE